MANSAYSRPASGLRFLPGGIKTTSPADGLKESEYPYLQNLRWTLENAPQCRPQNVQAIAAPSSGGGPVLSMEPSLGLYKIGNAVFYNGASVDGGYSANSASMTPFRPSESPSAWEYIWDSVQQRKIIPSGPTAQKIGIAEPQVPAEAFIQSPEDTEGEIGGGGGATGFANGGTAGSVTSAFRFTDTVLGAITDPEYVAPSGAVPFTNTSPICSVQVGSTVNYSKDQVILAGPNLVRVLDVIPPVAGTILIESIYYFLGSTGRCSIGLGTGFQNTAGEGILSSLRKGSLISIGSESPVYVLSVTSGPSGTVAIEVLTASNHTTADAITVLSTIVIDSVTPTVGALLTSGYAQSNIGSGIGTLSSNLGYNPFATRMFYDQDYFHFSVNISSLASLNEMKILIDVSDGTFTKDYYYYAVRASDIAAGVENTLTQLGVAQLAGQRQTIAEEAQSHGITSSSGETNPADGVWSEITFPISEFTRVGSDETKSLSTGSGEFQYLFNANASLTAKFSMAGAFGGFLPDIGISLNDYKFKYRGRSSVTGAKSNGSPEMRYGVRPHRSAIFCKLPTTAYDFQIDTWDVFIFGGSLDAYRYAGSIPVGSNNVFGYNMSDTQVAEAEILEDDNYEPFPTIDAPFTATASFAGGSAITASVVSPGNLLRFLPGNIIQIGENDYTLWQRPTLVSGTTYLFTTVESVSTGSFRGFSIAEPEIANQPLPYVWGPDNNGTMFGCGDALRPDFIYTTKANNPDACPDRNKEISVPTDPLVNGCLLDQTSFVASPSRWWRGYPSEQSGYVDYNWAEIPVGEGLAAPRGICSDGKAVYFVGHTGINATSGGAKKSLTDDALRNIFPHEDQAGSDVGVSWYSSTSPHGSYSSFTIHAPDYRYAATFRLSTCNGFLYFDYQDSTQTPRTLVMDLARETWGVDVYASPVTCRGVVTLPDNPVSGTRIARLYMGDVLGNIYNQALTPIVTGGGEAVACVLVTRLETAGDLRAMKQWGDIAVSINTGGDTMTVTAVDDNKTAILPATTGINLSEISLGGGWLSQALGLLIQWTDFGPNAQLYWWQPSYISKPETVTDRSSDWMNAGSAGNKFWQGFRVTMDTFNAAKSFSVYDETGTLQQTFTITTNGEVTKAYSFATPFYSHMVQVKLDSAPCREFGIEWVTQPAPEKVLNWANQPTSYGQLGYQHVRQMMVAHMSTVDLTLNVTVDNVALPSLTIPNSGGAYKKTLVTLTPNKGLVYTYQINSTAAFSLWEEDFEIWLKAWDSPGAYINAKLLGSDLGDKAEI